jgi:hypothetical protein
LLNSLIKREVWFTTESTTRLQKRLKLDVLRLAWSCVDFRLNIHLDCSLLCANSTEHNWGTAGEVAYSTSARNKGSRFVTPAELSCSSEIPMRFRTLD